MKKLILLMAALPVALSFLFVSCKPETDVPPQEEKPVAVTGVSLDRTTAEIEVGDVLRLTATVKPDDAADPAVSWASDAPEVASVDESGTVQAHKVGSAKITVTTADGGKTASCTVTVKANYEIRYNGSAVSGTLPYKPWSELSNTIPFTFYDKTTSAPVNPVDAKNTTVYSSDESVAKFHSISQDKIYVQALSTGSTKLTFSVNGQSVGSFTLTVLPSPEVYSEITGKAVASTESYVLGFLPNNLVRFEMYDLFTNKYYNPTGGLNVISSNPIVAMAVVDTYSGHQVWYVQGLQAGASEIYFLYSGEVIKQITYIVQNDRPMVDLGLGVKWATMNIGSSQPYEPGEFFAWGETQGKTDYSWSTYKWGTSATDLTKYDDLNGTLTAEDDVAQVRWGWGWRMPTLAEFSDLCTKCTWTETSLSGIKVFKVTGTNGNYIYLPLAGSYIGTKNYTYGNGGVYWTSQLWSNDSARTMVVNKGSTKGTTGQASSRCEGLSVRAVKPK